MLFPGILTRLHRIDKSFEGSLNRGGAIHEILYKFGRGLCHAQHVVEHEYLCVGAATCANADDRDIEFR